MNLQSRREGALEKGRWAALKLLAISSIAALAVACAPSDNTNTNTNEGGDTGASDIVLTTAASPTGPITQNFNPFVSTSTLRTLGGLNMIYETLFIFNELVAGEETPWLGESYEWAEDVKTLTIKTRQNAKWSDGEAFSANDVAFTFNLLKDNPGINTTGINFATAEATDDNTVVVTFDEPSRALFYYFATTPIVPEHLWSTVDDPVNFPDADPVGTGAFVLSEFSPQGYKTVRNEDYWQDPAKIKGLNWVVYNSNTSIASALAAGELNWGGSFVPNLEQQFIAKDPERRHLMVNPNRTNYLLLNTTRYPLDIPEVRQALSYAMDRPPLAERSSDGQKPPATNATGLALPRFADLIDPTFVDADLDYDPERAAQLLKDAGFTKDSNGMLIDPKGNPFKLEIMAVTAYTEQISAGQILVSQWKQLGVDASVNGVSLQAAIDSTGLGNFDLSINGSRNSPEPYDYYNPIMNCDLTSPIGEMAVTNLGRFCDDDAQKHLNALRTAITPEETAAALKGLQSIAVNKVPVLPYAYGVSFAEFTSDKVTGWPSEDNPYAMPVPGNPVVALKLEPVK